MFVTVASLSFFLFYVASWQVIWPGVALGLVIASFVLFGNALRDAFQGTYVKQSARARRREIQALLANLAGRTLGIPVASAAANRRRETGANGPLLAIEGLDIAYMVD